MASALFLVSIPFAHSASIAGTSCIKLNSTKIVSNVKFTCVKNGKKLVWNKVLAVLAKPSPSPSPSPTNTPSNATNAVPVPAPSPSASSSSEPTLKPAAAKYPKVGDQCIFDKNLAYRYSLIPGYNANGDLRWITCNGNYVYQLGLDQKVDEITLTPVIPNAIVKASNMSSYDSVSKATQEFIDKINLNRNNKQVTLQYFVEQIDMADYVEFVKKELESAMVFYDSIGLSRYMPKTVKVFIAKTNDGMTNMIKVNCNSRGEYWPGGTGASMCLNNIDGEIVINVPANVLGSMVYDPNVDLSTVTKSREMILSFRWAIAHELYHLYQLGNWRGNALGSHDPLPWIVEGSAQYFSMLYLAKDLGTPNAYQYLWEVIQLTNLVPPGQGPENGPLGCTNPAKEMAWGTEDARKQCQYTQGMLIAETFVARYGLSKWIELLEGQNNGNLNQFPSFFKTVTGDDVDIFYSAADQHSRNMGYQIK